jgi:hypothetical protein
MPKGIIKHEKKSFDILSKKQFEIKSKESNVIYAIVTIEVKKSTYGFESSMPL